MLQQMEFHIKDGVLNYVEGPPSGPPLVLIHGIASRWQVFLPILPALCVRWHVFALDLRGHGSSSRTSGSYVLKSYVSDVAAFVTSTFAEPCFLLGHSMGGATALLVAGTIPDRVAGVIAGDTPLLANQSQAARRLRRLVAHLRLLRPLAGRPISEILDRLPDATPASQALTEAIRQTDPEVFDFVSRKRLQEFGAGIDWEDMLAAAVCPVLMLQANPARGGFATAEDVEYELSVLSNVKHMALEQVGHDLGPLTANTAELLDAVLAFLETHPT